MDCLIRCLQPPQGQGSSLPPPGQSYSALAAKDRLPKEDQDVPLSKVLIDEIGKPGSPVGLRMKQLSEATATSNAQDSGTRSSLSSAYTISSKGSTKGKPLKATENLFRHEAAKADALAAAQVAVFEAKIAEAKAEAANEAARKKGMAYHMDHAGINPRTQPLSTAAKQAAYEAARAAAAAASVEPIKAGVQQAVKPRPVDPELIRSRKPSPVHSRSSSRNNSRSNSPASTYRAGSNSSSRHASSTREASSQRAIAAAFNGRPLDIAPPSYMQGKKTSSLVRPTRPQGDGGKSRPDERIAPHMTGQLDWQRMRWDEKFV